MGLIGWILVIVVGILGGSGLLLYAMLKNDDAAFGAVLGTILVFTGILVIISETKEPKPKALDVYRGKTTLEITYKDSVAVDSVVVFK